MYECDLNWVKSLDCKIDDSMWGSWDQDSGYGGGGSDNENDDNNYIWIMVVVEPKNEL